MKAPKEIASFGPTKTNCEQLLNTLLKASAAGCATLISAKLGDDGKRTLMMHIVDIEVVAQEEASELVEIFEIAVANHREFLGLAAIADGSEI